MFVCCLRLLCVCFFLKSIDIICVSGVIFIQSLRAFRLALLSWFGGSVVLFGLVCLVGLVGLLNKKNNAK